MSRTNRTQIVVAICFSIGWSRPAWRRVKPQGGARKSNKSAVVFREIMDIPDKIDPEGSARQGGVHRRLPQRHQGRVYCWWSRWQRSRQLPDRRRLERSCIFRNEGGSFGLQIGAESTDFVLLFMNEKAMQALLKSKFTLVARPQWPQDLSGARQQRRPTRP
jgi:hypothetical protein